MGDHGWKRAWSGFRGQLVELIRLQFLSESVLSKFGERLSAGTMPLCYRDSDANANELVQNQI
jgi:hypothetical protein